MSEVSGDVLSLAAGARSMRGTDMSQQQETARRILVRMTLLDGGPTERTRGCRERVSADRVKTQGGSRCNVHLVLPLWHCVEPSRCDSDGDDQDEKDPTRRGQSACESE